MTQSWLPIVLFFKWCSFILEAIINKKYCSKPCSVVLWLVSCLIWKTWIPQQFWLKLLWCAIFFEQGGLLKCSVKNIYQLSVKSVYFIYWRVISVVPFSNFCSHHVQTKQIKMKSVSHTVAQCTCINNRATASPGNFIFC